MRTPIQIGAALIAPLLICVGCPGTLDDPSRFLADTGAGEAGGPTPDASSCPDVPTKVFAQVCSTSGCHSAADKVQSLDLESPNVAARVVGTCAQGGGYLVDPSNPPQSVLYAKLTFTPPFGTRMPLGKPPLDAATIACVLAWVSAQSGSLTPCGADAAADARGEGGD